MAAHQLLLATRNQGKIAEFRRILDRVAAGEIELIGLDRFPDLHDVAETGATFEENALLKARAASMATGLTAIADDSGLCVDALNGDPGIYSARWSGVHGDDLKNTAKVLAQLTDVPAADRSAHFRHRLAGGANRDAAGRHHAERALPASVCTGKAGRP